MSQSLEILIFAVIAGYLFFRLWSVLGQTSGEEPHILKRVTPLSDVDDLHDNVISLPQRSSQEITESLLSEKAKLGLQELRDRQSDFNLNNFLNGAQSAFRMVVKAFAEGDRQLLKKLLSDGVYKNFGKVLDQREKDHYQQESRVDKVEINKIEDISVKGQEVIITLRFVSEQMLAIINAEGAIIDNPARLSIPMIDVWSFSRYLDSTDYNWSLIATRTETAS
ncbi:MAG: Tim44/TimA family putative adaptor protein [Alphaproteobacteria bacterium]